MGSPRQRGLKASGLQRRQSGGETHEHQTNQWVANFSQFLFGTYVLRDKSTRNNQEAQIAETHQFQRRRQNKEWNSRMWGINIDKLYEKRHIEQNGFRISQAQN